MSYLRAFGFALLSLTLSIATAIGWLLAAHPNGPALLATTLLPPLATMIAALRRPKFQLGRYVFLPWCAALVMSLVSAVAYGYFFAPNWNAIYYGTNGHSVSWGADYFTRAECVEATSKALARSEVTINGSPAEGAFCGFLCFEGLATLRDPVSTDEIICVAENPPSFE